MKRNLFITGATGNVGKGLIKKCIQEGEYDQIFALVHESNSATIENSKKIKVISGDITKKKLGLSSTIYNDLTEQVTDIIHCAGNVKFTLPLDTALAINLQGTVHVTAFAKACKHLKQYAFISTAYVAGKRTGEIREDELYHGAGFVNTYEASKYQAEIYLQKEAKNLPITIYRLSTIIGNDSGYVSQFQSVHYALKLFYNSLVPFVPSHTTSHVDFISLDYAVDAVFFLFTKYFSPGTTYQIVSGNTNAFTVQELIDETYTMFVKYDADFEKQSIEKPLVVDAETYNLFSNSVNELQNPLFLKVITSIDTFAPQMLYPKDFKNEKATAILKKAKIRPRPIREYYGKVVQYCLTSQWGKKPYGQEKIY